MSKTKVVTIHKAVAQCPACDGDEWLIQLDGFGQDYTHVVAHECAECGWRLEINVEIVKE